MNLKQKSDLLKKKIKKKFINGILKYKNWFLEEQVRAILKKSSAHKLKKFNVKFGKLITVNTTVSLTTRTNDDKGTCFIHLSKGTNILIVDFFNEVRKINNKFPYLQNWFIVYVNNKIYYFDADDMIRCFEREYFTKL